MLLQGTRESGFALDALPNRTAWRGTVALLLALALWGWFDVRQRAFVDPARPNLHKTDLTVYTEASAAINAGRDPYEIANPRGWGYVYPPIFAVLLTPLTALSPPNQTVVWFIVSIVFCWGCLRESRKLLHAVDTENGFESNRNFTPPLSFAVAAFAVAALPTLNCLQRGQVGILKLYLLLLGIRLLIDSRKTLGRLLGGIVLAAPVAVKVTPLLPVCVALLALAAAWFFAKRRSSDRLGLAGGQGAFSAPLGFVLGLILFLFVLPGAAIGQRENWSHLQTWAKYMLAKADDGGSDPKIGNSQSLRNQSLQNAVYRFGNFAAYELAGGSDDRLADNLTRPKLFMDFAPTNSALLVARIAILLALAATTVRLARRLDALRFAVLVSLACTAMLVVSPVSRGHYFMFAAPAAFFVPLYLAKNGFRRQALASAVTPVALVNLHYLALAWSGRIGLLGIGSAVWLMTALIVVTHAAAVEECVVEEDGADVLPFRAPEEIEAETQTIPLRRAA